MHRQPDTRYNRVFRLIATISYTRKSYRFLIDNEAQQPIRPERWRVLKGAHHRR
jgi:hypothetical protein